MMCFYIDVVVCCVSEVYLNVICVLSNNLLIMDQPKIHLNRNHNVSRRFGLYHFYGRIS